ncbi:unnamed protein product [Moneuplotes crassus]|uniref:Uncharacterized protein n=1 Tax=Euplotes crassus TaxID=5936 RepID=A0AAD1UA99_EUPCR|nr:unnamed protein product [Moneuplotes crassus]
MFGRIFVSKSSTAKLAMSTGKTLLASRSGIPSHQARSFHSLQMARSKLPGVCLYSSRSMAPLGARLCSTTTGVSNSSGIDQIVSKFQSFNQLPDVMEITQIMERIVNTTLTVEEHNGFQPFMEEVADVALRNIDDASNGSQVLTYMRFFLEKGDSSPSVWRRVDQALLTVLENASTETILEIYELLKNNKRLTQESGMAIANELKNRISSTDLSKIATSTSIICAFSLQDHEFTTALEEGLLGLSSTDSTIPTENIKKMSTEDFSLLCRMISHYNLTLDEFLLNSRSYVTEKMNRFTPQELGDVLFTYLVRSQDSELAIAAEKRILEVRKTLTIDDCISLMNAYMLYESSEDLWNVFDVVIGTNIKKIDESQIVPVLQMFSKAPHNRMKLFLVFVHKIRNSRLELTQLASLARIYGEVGYTDADIYSYLDSTLSNRVLQMGDEEITNTLIGFMNPDIKGKFKVIENIEDRIHQIMSKVSLHNVTVLLLKYGQLRHGSKILIKSCLKRVEDIYSTTNESVSPMQLMMTLYGYSLVGAEAKSYYPVLKHIIAAKDELDYGRLTEIFSILMKFQDDEEFLTALVEIRHKLEKYNTDGTLKADLE